MAEQHPIPTHGWFKNYLGLKFGHMTVTGYAGVHRSPKGTTWQKWYCLCECGKTKTLPVFFITGPHPDKDCGCGLGWVASDYNVNGTPEFRSIRGIWYKMIGRCHRPDVKCFSYYGGRGITVCQRWRDSFEAFLEDMGPRPSPAYSIERIDNSKNYEPDNCKWATKLEQSTNRRSTVLIEWDGKSQSAAQWARDLGVDVSYLLKKLKRGRPLEEVLCVPTRIVNRDGVTWRGETHTVTEWSHITGIGRNTIYQRIKHGWSLDDAFGTPTGEKPHSRTATIPAA